MANILLNGLAESLITALANEIRVIELYSKCLKHEISDDMKDVISAIINAKKRHMKMLSDFFEKKFNKKLDDSKIKELSLENIKSLAFEQYTLHLLDVALGYQTRGKDHLERSAQNFSDYKDVQALFTKLIEEEEEYIAMIEKEIKAEQGKPFNDFELDLFVRE
ncbi:MAG: hypothetical protein D6734_07640 [Candidatus Schekmanbacteria bacterium]|nr:MAG: hypothetical protein D6734_07640 [Candidatus Schekmanbacteria bacterium]